MPKHELQKWKLPVLARLLLEQSDEEHPISTTQLLTHLAKLGIGAERKSIYSDMAILREAGGLDIQNRKGAQGGWFIGARTFELAELKLLADAVQASRFVTSRKSRALMAKLETLTSRHTAAQLQRQVYADRRDKTENESIYYTIDALHTAINQRREISFRYFDYNVKKRKVFRREGGLYRAAPCGLIWDNRNYYLVGWDYGSRELRHYRTDKMADLSMGGPCPSDVPAGRSFPLDKYVSKHFGMFSGRETTLTLVCENALVGVMLDRFGHGVMLTPRDAEHFSVMVDAVVSPQLWGWLCGLGEQIRLESPAWAAGEYCDWLSGVLARHRPETPPKRSNPRRKPK